MRVDPCFIAAMPIAGMAAMKNVTVTCAPLIGLLFASGELHAKDVAAFVRRRGISREVQHLALRRRLVDVAPPAPGGGGTKAPAAA